MSKFKIYEFIFKGMCLGGKVLVVSTNKEQAEKHARKEVDGMGRPNDPLEFVAEYDIHEGSIPYSWNGDY